jgi:hypothetical protein
MPCLPHVEGARYAGFVAIGLVTGFYLQESTHSKKSSQKKLKNNPISNIYIRNSLQKNNKMALILDWLTNSPGMCGGLVV